jgi:hypothetical protein
LPSALSRLQTPFQWRSAEKFAIPAGAPACTFALTACSGNGEDSNRGGTEAPAAHVVNVEKDKTASFAARHALKVTVPEGSKNVRVRFALPRSDPSRQISDLKIECPLPSNTVSDSEGNTSRYVEAENATEIEILSKFGVARTESA